MRFHHALLLALLAAALPAHAGERALIDTTRSPDAKMYMPDLSDVHWTGGLMGERFQVCRDTMVPHLWSIFSNPKESAAWENFRMAAGLSHGRDGKPHGPPFNDGDFLKWVESLAQVYAVTHDPAVDRQLDQIIAVIAKAQRPDGYLDTPIIIRERNAAAEGRKLAFANREHFETYNMGHLMTTACIHYRATGKTSLLDCARKAADYLDRLCASDPQSLALNAICPSHYMGVVELYRTTHDPRYLALAKRLIEIRSLVPPSEGSDMNQDRIPFREMTGPVGHAVRANYLFAGVADVYSEDGDASLLRTLVRVDNDAAGAKLYITGMTGALYDGASPDGSAKDGEIKLVHQAYGRDYQLPNLTAYNESCATVGFALWQWRMFEDTGVERYVDLFEQSLYNGVLAGISMDGKDYFYTNPLRRLHAFNWPLRWSRTRQPNYKSSFCCPPNIVRTIAEAQNYIYTLSKDTLWVNLYGDSALDTRWLDGSRIKLNQETNYPWDGAVKLSISAAPSHPVTLRLRIPGWMHPGATTITVNGRAVAGAPQPGSYFDLTRTWKSGDTVGIAFDFKPVLMEANPLVEETLNQVAVKYGPIVYCLEAKDLPPGVKLTDVALALDPGTRKDAIKPIEIGGAHLLSITVPGWDLQESPWQKGQLYREVSATPPRPISVTLIPYFAWNNRGDYDMSVWLPAR